MRGYLQLLKSHGIKKFAHKTAGRFDQRLLGSRASHFFYNRAIKGGRVYLGNYVSANQGNFRRHVFMDRLIAYIARRNAGAIEVMEAGTYAGASAIVWAKAITKYNAGNGSVLCVDPWELLYSLEDGKGKILERMSQSLRDGTVFRLFQHNMKAAGVHKLVSFNKAFSDTAFPELEKRGRRFDVIYIDGDHRHQQVIKDLTMARRLLKPGGTLCGDDFELPYDAVDQAVCRQSKDIDFICDPKTGWFYHPGVTYALQEFMPGLKVGGWNGFWAMTLNAQDKFSAPPLS